MQLDELLPSAIRANVRAALAEDIGSGDITAQLIPEHERAEARVITRQDGVFCGRPWADAACHEVDPSIDVT